jgi:hypothetical protein
MNEVVKVLRGDQLYRKYGERGRGEDGIFISNGDVRLAARSS